MGPPGPPGLGEPGLPVKMCNLLMLTLGGAIDTEHNTVLNSTIIFTSTGATGAAGFAWREGPYRRGFTGAKGTHIIAHNHIKAFRWFNFFFNASSVLCAWFISEKCLNLDFSLYSRVIQQFFNEIMEHNQSCCCLTLPVKNAGCARYCIFMHLADAFIQSDLKCI